MHSFESFVRDSAQLNLKSVFVQAVLTGVYITTADTWSFAIYETLSEIKPLDDGILAEYVAAIIMTLLATIISLVIVTFFHASVNQHLQQEATPAAIQPPVTAPVRWLVQRKVKKRRHRLAAQRA